MARVFFSYAVRDKPVVRRIAAALRAAGHAPWLEEDDILVGESIPAAVERGMRDADFVILCLSKANTKLGATLMQQFHERKERILPVRLEDVALPHLLAKIAHVDLFPDEQAFEQGMTRLTRSIKAHQTRRADAGLPVMSFKMDEPTGGGGGLIEVDGKQVQLPHMGLNNLGNGLSSLGEREAALAATREAVELYRALAERTPDAFQPGLAMSLNNLGLVLSNVGQREAALAVTREAVELRRALAARNPDAFQPELATSLNNLGLMLSNVGQQEAALAATREAEQLRAMARPGEQLPDNALAPGGTPPT
jgi:tetratricopeptide (TPR) repeat protein